MVGVRRGGGDGGKSNKYKTSHLVFAKSEGGAWVMRFFRY